MRQKHIRNRRSVTRFLGIVTVLVGILTFPVSSASATNTPPKIISLTTSTALMAPTAGAVKLVAKVSGASICQITVTPIIAHEPPERACAGSSFVFSTTVDLPTNASASRTKFTIQLVVVAHFSDGTSANTSHSTTVVVKSYLWNTITKSVTFPMTPTAISCDGATTCAVVGTKGYVGILTPSGAHFTHIDGNNTLTSVSCGTTSPMTCLAVDSIGNVVPLGPLKWMAPEALSTDPTNPHPNLLSISCVRDGSTKPEKLVCMASDDLGRTYIARATNGIIVLKSGSGIGTPGGSLLSCSSGTVLLRVKCHEVNGEGDSAFFNGSSWGPSESLFVDGGASEGPVTALTCASDSTCIVTDQLGTTVWYAQDSIHLLRVVREAPDTFPFTSVTCPLTTLCMAGDATGRIFQQVRDSDIVKNRSSWAQIQPPVKNAIKTLVTCSSGGTTAAILGCIDIIVKSGGPVTMKAGRVSIN